MQVGWQLPSLRLRVGLRKSGAITLRKRKHEYGNVRDKVNRRRVKANGGIG